MGVQISCGFHSEIPEEDDFWRDQEMVGDVFHDLARRRECKIEEGHLMPDHVHMLISIPPKYSVAEVIGFMKGKSSIWIAQNVDRKARNFTGHKFWAPGYSSRRQGETGSPLGGFSNPHRRASLSNSSSLKWMNSSFETRRSRRS
jgi:hypothetical protein